MLGIEMPMNELLTLKALQFKSRLCNKGGSGLFARMVERDERAAEDLGMKNMCFRADPLLQARFEVALEALGMSKQEALTEAVYEFLRQVDVKLDEVGLGPLVYEARLRELGFKLTDPDPEGSQRLVRVGQEG